MTLRVAFIGAGRMARHHLGAIRRLAAPVAVVGVHDRAIGLAGEFATLAGARALRRRRGNARARTPRRRARLHASGCALRSRRRRTRGRCARVRREAVRLDDGRRDPAARHRAHARPARLRGTPAALRSRVRGASRTCRRSRVRCAGRQPLRVPSRRRRGRTSGARMLARQLVDILPHPLYSLVAMLERFTPPATDIDAGLGPRQSLRSSGRAPCRRRHRAPFGQPPRQAGRLVTHVHRHTRFGDLRLRSLDHRRRRQPRNRTAREGPESGDGGCAAPDALGAELSGAACAPARRTRGCRVDRRRSTRPSLHAAPRRFLRLTCFGSPGSSSSSSRGSTRRRDRVRRMEVPARSRRVPTLDRGDRRAWISRRRDRAGACRCARHRPRRMAGCAAGPGVGGRRLEQGPLGGSARRAPASWCMPRPKPPAGTRRISATRSTPHGICCARCTTPACGGWCS